MRFGVHISTGGKLADAPSKAQEIGCRAMQIFAGNPRGWTKPPLDPEVAAAFRESAQAADIDPVVVHATYLINLAAPEADIYDKSVAAFIDELQRSAMLGAAYYVVHCGSHKGTGEDGGRHRIVQALRQAADAVPESPTILLENTAGTANSLGTTFADLAALLNAADLPNLGVCFDTCHALAAGFEIRTPQGTAETLDALERSVGLPRLHLLHINDSKGDLASHLDRHEHIGQGTIGPDGFRAFFSDQRLWNLPAILETPVDTPEDDHRNLWSAVELAATVGAVQMEYLEFMPTARLDPVKPKGETPELVTSAPKQSKMKKKKKIAVRKKTGAVKPVKKKRPAKKKAKKKVAKPKRAAQSKARKPAKKKAKKKAVGKAKKGKRGR